VSQLEYVQLRAQESHYQGGFTTGLKIEVSSPCPISEELERLSIKVADQLNEQMVRDYYKGNKEAQDAALAERVAILACFSSKPIFVEAIPNGYCSKACCEHLPWYVVTTRLGRIKIGWRKSVIHIDWMDSLITKTAEEMFKEESTTKGERLIHAHGYEKAREYLGVLLA